MMKKRINYIVLILCSISIFSCNDWLQEDPRTFISPTSFYKTIDDFDGALKGLYPQEITMDLVEVFADFNDKPESSEQVGDIWNNNPGFGFKAIRSAWSNAYSSIKNANMVLQSLESIDFPAETTNRIIGEAKFIRAWCYFDLVQLYGDVPLRNSVVTSSTDVAITKSSEKEIYDFIFADIKDAEDKLPNEAQSMGRANKWMAKALMARIYLVSAGYPMNITANYALARDKALEVINSKEYSLMSTIDKVFKTDKYTNETIWARLFAAPDSYSLMHINTAPIKSQTALFLPTDNFINTFSVGDNRKEWGIPSEYVTAKGTKMIDRPYYNKFIDEEFLEQEMPATNTRILTYQTQLIRLAEMYLIAAEAENEVNGPDNAYQYINEIRKRARVDQTNSTHVPDLSGLTQASFRDAVLLERKFEFYSEGFAWYDMKRTQTFDCVQKERGDQLNVAIGSYNNRWLIPDTEILNNNIPQNQEYR